MDREGEELPSDIENEMRERPRIVPKEYFADIRAVMFAMYSEKKHVILDTLLDEIKAHRDPVCFDWMWSRATFHRVLTESMAFTYDTRPFHYKTLREQQSVALLRLNYIQQIRVYRAEGRPIWYQDELNPIELIWADAKGFITKNNVTFSLSDVERLAHERINVIGKVEWEKCVRHCIEVEDNYYAAADDIPFDE